MVCSIRLFVSYGLFDSIGKIETQLSLRGKGVSLTHSFHYNTALEHLVF